MTGEPTSVTSTWWATATAALGVMLGLSVGVSGCWNLTCNSMVIVDPRITVTDGRDGSAICDATVVLVSSSLEYASDAALVFADAASINVDAGVAGSVLQPSTVDGGVCAYSSIVINSSPSNAFTILVEKAGFHAVRASNVVTRSQDCSIPSPSPPPQQVHVVLYPV
jgi:hypothetical protein